MTNQLFGLQFCAVRQDTFCPHQDYEYALAEVPDIYFTLLDAAGISPTLILNQNAKAKGKSSWVPFKI